MKRVILMCAGGMSSSFLEMKIREAVKRHGGEYEVEAVSTMNIDEYIGNTDLFLLAPQVKYQLLGLKEKCDKQGVPIEVINSLAYGRMDGEAIFKQVLDVFENK